MIDPIEVTAGLFLRIQFLKLKFPDIILRSWLLLLYWFLIMQWSKGAGRTVISLADRLRLGQAVKLTVLY